MGAVHFSLDVRLVQYLKQALPLSTFVETGTFEGASVDVCLPYFESIHTVELSDTYYRAAVEKFRDRPRVHVWPGMSADCLRSLAGALRNESALYWLDAHWCAAEEVGSATAQCPLLDELEALTHLNGQSVVCIDDARLFLCPPPHPHQTEDWPSFHEIASKLYGLSAAHELLMVNDVMVFYPVSSKDAVYAYARQHGVDWLSVLGKARDYDRFLPVIQREADRRAAGLQELTAVIAARESQIAELEETLRERLDALHELTAVIAARDGRIRDLEDMARERLDALHELTAIIRVRDKAIEDLEGTARERLAGLHELTAVIGARDERIRDLEGTSRDRLEALQHADTLHGESKAETERQAAALLELIAMVVARDGRINELEETVRQRLDALHCMEALLREARTELEGRIAELRDSAATLAARDQSLAQLSERITALMAQEDMLRQKVLLLEKEGLKEFLARRARALWPR